MALLVARPTDMPDLHNLLYGWKDRTLNEDDYCRLIGCIFREASHTPYFNKLSGAMPLAEWAQRQLPAGITLSEPQPGLSMPIEVPDEVGVKRFSTPLLARLPEGIKVAILEYTTGLARYRLLDEMAYLREMRQQGLEPHQAVRRLFISFCFAAIASEYPNLMNPVVLRLAKLGGDIGRIFAIKGLTWVE
ncbi:hypothetical protein A3B21_03970 [Candidatus Uhrbacteria bacterium RIFCSPLOWO2_01_FULL_47_24]|uniref:Uncharacterized protein n=1 Tax=Candidatus Uhrbacteria bacterium RIFCSPLOWO2_01_FULL_47_24 TaxID=1802401 RepID=A0A1F7UUV3_9BACT|nr:MAG: hypothetical protein A2753_00715 [Candidatus Uhrbacteria bacterium RIFCSPHIGHO2_01_FULL_47_11]OGL69127.1 MAG: hypothetical protein A3D58_02670 [Candidatus Uhrbacteria bacterium RIFCSPHIGHO2_02_FULL_46_47]OGL81498.1 MAG: hypothetical protein A3B21_03970 [Candidatus Uhrbacteria bacterium RIFCSPLOWO2_01_FULL_47_24]OGL83743.1 MAG: hypothetical protein A3J03_01425 [Candidatus Uhrbacteria bacterium RIFCSPLOWO2_02_FULL_46_25]OGL93612.1 MAG: hypothetical protein A3H11_05305 [Candidatus Uhrbacte